MEEVRFQEEEEEETATSHAPEQHRRRSSGYYDYEGTHSGDASVAKRLDRLEEEDSDDEVLMNSVHEGGFDAAEFWLQVSLHLFYPLSLLWYPRSRWPQGARNQVLLSTNLFSLQFHAFPFVCWAQLILYLSRPPMDVSIEEVFTVPFLLVLSRIVLIGLKYATLTAGERDAFFRETDATKAKKWLLQSQLISGWLAQRDDVLKSELRGAATKLGIDLPKTYFVVEANEQKELESLTAWNRLMRSSSTVQLFEGEEECKIPVGRVIEILLRAARAKAPVLGFKAATVLGFIFAAVPVIIRDRRRGDWISLCSLLVSVYVTSLGATIFIIFLSVNVVHYYRTSVVSRWVALLIRVSFEAHPHFPQIQLCQHSKFGAHNTLAWIQCRSLLCYFGKRYEQRLDSYVALAAFISVVGISVPTLKLLRAGGFGDGDDDDLQSDLARMRRQSFTWVAVLLFILSMSVLTVSVLFASQGNRHFESALASLSQHRLKLRTAITDACQVDEAYEATLQLAKDELDVLNRIHVFRIAGQPADAPMAINIATTSTTVVFYFFAALFGLFL